MLVRSLRFPRSGVPPVDNVVNITDEAAVPAPVMGPADFMPAAAAASCEAEAEQLEICRAELEDVQEQAQELQQVQSELLQEAEDRRSETADRAERAEKSLAEMKALVEKSPACKGRAGTSGTFYPHWNFGSGSDPRVARMLDEKWGRAICWRLVEERGFYRHRARYLAAEKEGDRHALSKELASLIRGAAEAEARCGLYEWMAELSDTLMLPHEGGFGGGLAVTPLGVEVLTRALRASARNQER